MKRLDEGFLNTTNVVSRLIISTVSLTAFLLPILVLSSIGLAQNVADYAQSGSGNQKPGVSVEVGEKRSEKVLPPSSVIKPLPSLLTSRGPLSFPGEIGKTPKEITVVAPVQKVNLPPIVVTPDEKITLESSGQSQFFFDVENKTGVAVDQQGAEWQYGNVSMVNETQRMRPPEGFVEVGRFVSSGPDRSRKVIYGKPAGEIEEIALDDNLSFIYDAKTETAALLDGREGEESEGPTIKQYKEVHVLTVKSMSEDISIPDGFVEIGRFSQPDFILPDNTTIVANKVIYAKFDREIFVLQDLKEISITSE